MFTSHVVIIKRRIRHRNPIYSDAPVCSESSCSCIRSTFCQDGGQENFFSGLWNDWWQYSFLSLKLQVCLWSSFYTRTYLLRTLPLRAFCIFSLSQICCHNFGNMGQAASQQSVCLYSSPQNSFSLTHVPQNPLWTVSKPLSSSLRFSLSHLSGKLNWFKNVKQKHWTSKFQIYQKKVKFNFHPKQHCEHFINSLS